MPNLSNLVEMTLVLFLLIILFKFTRYLKKSSQNDTEQQEYIQKIEKEDAALREEVATLEDKLRETFQDSVTHVLSWSLFQDRVEQSIKESERHQMDLALLYVDIDDFNTINNALGTDAGDQVLAEVSSRLDGCIRKADSLSRFSKDTFVLLLTQLKKPEVIAIVAQRVMEAMKKPILVNGQELMLTVCIGIAVSPVDAKKTSALMQCANHALYLAKKNGPQSHQFYHEKMQNNSKRELQITTGLNAEVTFDDFEVVYKPILNVESNTIFCMENALQWHHPEAGLITANEIFEHAEKQRKANVIVEWVLEHAIAQYLSWQKQGVVIPCVSIPLPANLLENSHFIYHVSKQLQESNFPAEKLILEIDGGFGELSLDVLEKAVNMLRYLKVKLSVTHFGSDSLSLRHLKQLRPEYLKLDSSLVDGVVEDAETQSLLGAIKALAGSLSSEVILEGVKSADQVGALKQLGFVLMNDPSQLVELSADDVLSRYRLEAAKE